MGALRIRIVSTVVCGLLAMLGTGFAGDANDLAPPEVTILSPLPGAMLEGDSHVSVKGVAKDDGSGVKTLRLDGKTVPIDAAGTFSVPLLLDFGTNVLSLEAEDNAGNSARTTWAFLYSPAFLPAQRSVPRAVATFLPRRLAPAVSDALTAALGLDADGFAQALVGQHLDGGTVVQALLAPPDVSVEPSEDAYRVKVRFPWLETEVQDAKGSRTVSEDDVEFWARVRPPEPASRGSDVEVTDVEVRTPGSLRRRDRALEADLEHAWEKGLPPVVGAALKEAFGDRCEDPLPSGLTTCFERATLDVDPRGVLVVADANVVVKSPRDPALPGSVFREVGDPPAAGGHFAASASENWVNRVLFAAWAAGSSPIEIDAEFLRPFFPGKDPNARLALEIDPRLPATARVGGRKRPASLTLGEVHLTFRAFPPDPVQPALLLSFVVHLEATLDAALAPDASAVLVSPASWRMLGGSVEANPLDLDPDFLQAMLDRLLPRALPYLAGIIEEIPIPSYEGYGLKVESLGATGDGDYLTVAGDLLREDDGDDDEDE
jgi:hypothetical protein